MTISITSQQNVCEEKKVIEQFQLFIFGTEVLISLISSLGGWWGCGWVVFLAKGTTSRTLVFLISDKKGTSKSTKIAILRKKGTLGSQWQSLINSQNWKHLFNRHFTPTLCDTTVRSTTYFKCFLFQINKNLNHFLTPTLLPPCDTLNNTTQILIPGRAKEKSFRITSYQDLGIFGVKIPLNVSTVSLLSPPTLFTVLLLN